MAVQSFEFDEVGEWSELKLEILSAYGSAYTKAFAKHSYLKKYYIDGFCGAGVHISKATKNQIEGSPARALRVEPPFDRFYFIDIDGAKTDYLAQTCTGRNDVEIHTGDSVTYLKQLLPTIRYQDYKRALCLLDPYGLHLDWEVMRLAGQSGAVDMFLNFPVMDMNRNAIWHDPSNVPKDGVERMTRFWGDESWREVAYADDPQTDMFGDSGKIKQSNDAIVRGFQKRLQNIAGFQYVPEPMPMRNTRNAVVYYLFFASAKPVAENIIKEIFAKHR